MAFDTSQNKDLELSLYGFHEKLCHKLYSLWKALQFCDLKLQTSGGIVHAHSCLLAAFSPTIADILLLLDNTFQKKKEKSQKYVTIVVDHLNIEVLQPIVSFIYTGQLVVPSKHIKKVFEASRWLKMQDLSSLIEQTIAQQDEQTTRSASAHSVVTSGQTTNHPVVLPIVKQVNPSSPQRQFLSPHKDLCATQSSHQVSGFSCTESDPSPFTVSTNHSNAETTDSSLTRNICDQINYSPPLQSVSSNMSQLTVSTNHSNTETTHSSSTRKKSDQINYSPPLQPVSSNMSPLTVSTNHSNTEITDSSMTRNISDQISYSPPLQPVSSNMSPLTVSTNHSNTETTHSSSTRKESDQINYSPPLQPVSSNMSPLTVKTNHSNTETTQSSSTRKKRDQINYLPPLQPVSSMPKQSSTVKSTQSSVVTPGDSDSTIRRGNRKRKKTKKWEESYLFSPDKLEEEGTLLDCSVSLIKIEVDDLSNYQSPADQLNFINCRPGFLSVSDENAILSSHGVDMSVLDGSVKIEEVTDDGDIQMILNASQDCNSTVEVYSETSGAIHNQVLFSFNDELEKSDTNQGSTVNEGEAPVLEVCSKVNGEGFTIDKDDSAGDVQSTTSSEGGSAYENPQDKPMPTTSADADLTENIDASSSQANKKRRQKLKNHSQIALFNPYKCQKCFLRFDNIDKYNKHINNHPVFSCEECPLYFFAKTKLTRHQLSIHLKNNHLICKECPSFQAKSCTDFIHHSIQVHNQPKPFTCTHPGCSFRSVRHVTTLNHQKVVHAVERNNLCSRCGKAFSNPLQIESHLKSCLRKEEHLCDVCGAGFNMVAYLVSHKNAVHRELKNYKCKICFKRFSNNSNLRRHLRIHNNVFPYTCPTCKKKFRHSNTLKGHLEIHQREGIHVENPYDSSRYNYKIKTKAKRKL